MSEGRMTRAPDWTSEEFEIVLRNPGVPAATLALQLPRRTADAIEVVRQGIHAHHTGGRLQLSRMMKQRLTLPRSPLTCSECGVTF